MKDWVKKNKDTILIVGVSTIATAVVAGVTYKISTDLWNANYDQHQRLMSLIASDAGVLDKILAHQEKLTSIHQ